MNDNIFEQLAEALDCLPNGFPRTPSNVEIPMLRKIFAEQEAAVAVKLTGEMELTEEIAQKLELTPRETRGALMKMAKKGMVWFERKDGKSKFRLAPFMVGIYEDHIDRMDQEFARLFERYILDGGGAGLMTLQPSLTRVVPADGSVQKEWVLPYEDVAAILRKGKSFRVQECICRKQQDFVGRKCDFPLGNCLAFSTVPKPASPDDITHEQALELLNQAEELGLVHTVSNVRDGLTFVCNCCGCCCGILRSINELGIENSVAYANYFAVIDDDVCAGCLDCVGRCQVYAITTENGIPGINRDKCIGCGLCVTGCTTGAARLVRKPDDEIVHPPKDFDVWDRLRLENRGMTE